MIRQAALVLPGAAREALALVYFEGRCGRGVSERAAWYAAEVLVRPARIEQRLAGSMRLLDSGETHGALRGALALSPPSDELN